MAARRAAFSCSIRFSCSELAMMAPMRAPARAPAPAPMAAPSPPPAMAPMLAPVAAPPTMPIPALVGTPLPAPIPLLFAVEGAEDMSWDRYCFTSSRIAVSRSSRVWVAARRLASPFSSSPRERRRAGGGVVASRTKMASRAGMRVRGRRSALVAFQVPEERSARRTVQPP